MEQVWVGTVKAVLSRYPGLSDSDPLYFYDWASVSSSVKWDQWSAFLISAYTKIGIIQGLAWPRHKDAMQIYEAFHKNFFKKWDQWT